MEESNANIFEVHVSTGDKPEVKIYVNKELALLIHVKITPEDILDNFNRFLLSGIRDDQENRKDVEKLEKGIFKT